ncbi:MAG TPA: hypothetical protein PK530_11945 [Anaerolineales bacterium]|nr:hypothetical protein [Anaerolineales bacterium]
MSGPDAIQGFNGREEAETSWGFLQLLTGIYIYDTIELAHFKAFCNL